MRGVNLSLPNYDVYAATVPQIQQIAGEIIALKRRCLVVKVDTCKRDIEAAFKRVYLHPDLVCIACHEFRGALAGTEEDLVVGFLFLPFGFSGSPGLFQVATDALRAVHMRTGPSTPERDGHHAFGCHVSADDGIFVEPRMGKRHPMVVGKWENAVMSLPGTDAINEERSSTEGSWSIVKCIICFEIDTGEMANTLPSVKVEAARQYIAGPAFGRGDFNISVKEVQNCAAWRIIGGILIYFGKRPRNQSTCCCYIS